MQNDDKSYIEGVKEGLEAVSAALDTIRDSIDNLLAEIAILDDNSIDWREINRKCGIDENDN